MRAPRSRRAIIGFLAVSCLALAGILATSATAGESDAAAKQKVSIVEFSYMPGRTVIAAGGKVTFDNTSTYTHTATHKGVFETGKIPPGQSATVTFKKPGVYAFHCLIHPFMTGKIIVK